MPDATADSAPPTKDLSSDGSAAKGGVRSVTGVMGIGNVPRFETVGGGK